MIYKTLGATAYYKINRWLKKLHIICILLMHWAHSLFTRISTDAKLSSPHRVRLEWFIFRVVCELLHENGDLPSASILLAADSFIIKIIIINNVFRWARWLMQYKKCWQNESNLTNCRKYANHTIIQNMKIIYIIYVLRVRPETYW